MWRVNQKGTPLHPLPHFHMKDVDYKEAMACCDADHCTADGIAMGFTLSRACFTNQFWCADSSGTQVEGSSFASRVFIPSPNVRQQLQQFAWPPRQRGTTPGLDAADYEQLCAALGSLGLQCVAELCTPADASARMLLPQPRLREFLFALAATASACQLAPAATWPALRKLADSSSLTSCSATEHASLGASSPVLYNTLRFAHDGGQLPQSLSQVLALLVKKAEAALMPATACAGCSSCSQPSQPPISSSAPPPQHSQPVQQLPPQQQRKGRSDLVASSAQVSALSPGDAIEDASTSGMAMGAWQGGGGQRMWACLKEPGVSLFLLCLPGVGRMNEEETFMRCGYWFGVRHGLKRRLHRYSADTLSKQQLRQEFCNKHAYSTKKFVPGVCSAWHLCERRTSVAGAFTCRFYSTERSAVAGTFLIWCMKHSKCVGFFVMHESESPRALFEALYTRWGSPPAGQRSL